MNTVNDYLAHDDTPYSDDLINVLENFYYTGSDQCSDIEATHVDPNGEEVPNWTDLPTPEWIRDEMLPFVQNKVRLYRGITKPPPGYYDQLDVSWTKPDSVMPFR